MNVNIRDEGHNAFLDAVMRGVAAVCPYDEGTDEYKDWMAGYNPGGVKRRAHKIVCAACRNRKTGDIIAGVRHWDEIMRAQVGDDVDGAEWEQGFLDNKCRFLTRQKAWGVAEAASQIIRRCGGDGAKGGTLYSENLY